MAILQAPHGTFDLRGHVYTTSYYKREPVAIMYYYLLLLEYVRQYHYSKASQLPVQQASKWELFDGGQQGHRIYTALTPPCPGGCSGYWKGEIVVACVTYMDIPCPRNGYKHEHTLTRRPSTNRPARFLFHLHPYIHHMYERTWSC